MDGEKISPERAKAILDLQVEAAKKDIPCMVFIDRDAMREAYENMRLGASIKELSFFFLPEVNRVM